MRALAAFAVNLLLATAPSASPLLVEDAWIRAAPPGAVVLAGYATLRNEGPAAVHVVGASSDDFERVEIHEMSMHDGVMRMRALERVEVPAQDAIALAPGGTHLMLHEPRRALAAGDKVVIELRDSGGGATSATFEVRAP